MGTDTKAYIPGATREQIVKYLSAITRSKIDPLKSMFKEMVTLNFKYRDEDRTIVIHDTVIDQKADTKKWKSKNNDSVSYVKEGLPDNTKGVHLSLGAWGSAIDIMKFLCFMLGGGYIDERDTDDKGYKRVAQKSKREVIRYFFQHK